MEKVWQTQYPEGVPLTVNVPSTATLVDMLDECYGKYGDKTAFSCMGTPLTYAKMQQDVYALGAYLVQVLGLKKGERVAVMMPNVLQNPIAIQAILHAGLVVVNVNPLYTPRELAHQLQDSGARVILIVENFAHVLAKVLAKSPVEHVVLTSLGEMLNFPSNWLVDFVVRRIKKLVPPFQLPKFVSFRRALQLGAAHDYQPHPVQGEDIAFLQYTGGTTGVSKGAILTHYNMSANVAQAYSWLAQAIHEGQEIVITALPLYHIFALMANCFVFMRIGGHNVLITNPRDMNGFVKTLQRIPFTVITGVNTLFNSMLNHPRFAALDFSHLKITLGAGMAVQRTVAERWQKVTGCTMIQAYGLTETSPAACINPLDAKEFNGSIGVALPSTDVSIRNDAGEELNFHEPGEIWLQGPQVMRGYWQRPEETERVLSDGWLKTGDIGTIDESGYVYIVDRKKDMILVSGFNVYPNEIEDVVSSHAGVLEVAAIGVPSERSGEVVKIFVVRKDASLSAEELIAFCRRELTGYKVPRYVEFRDELPKTNVGKILRRMLKPDASS